MESVLLVISSVSYVVTLLLLCRTNANLFKRLSEVEKSQSDFRVYLERVDFEAGLLRNRTSQLCDAIVNQEGRFKRDLNWVVDTFTRRTPTTAEKEADYFDVEVDTVPKP